MMIKKIALKGVLLAFVAFLLSFACFSTIVQAYDLYELKNIVTNGNMDYCTGSDATGWIYYNASSRSCSGSSYKVNAIDGGSALQVYNSPANISITSGHIYYLNVNASYSKPSLWKIKIDFYSSGLWDNIYQSATDISGSYSVLHTALYTGNKYLYFQLQQIGSGTLTTSNNIILNSIMVIDLTAQFGAGNEPSLTDFELIYLPDLDYFDTYASFVSDEYIQLSSGDYTDIGTDLTGIDYSKAVIDTYGENINMDIYAYFFDVGSISGSVNAQYYKTVNNPVIKWRSKTETLSWIDSDYSDRVLLLDMDDAQEQLAKRALFDRSIDGSINGSADASDDGYMSFVLEPTAIDNVKFYIVFSSVFDLRVDISSVMLSYEMDNGSNEFGIVQEAYFKFRDKYDRELLPSLSLNTSDYGSYVISDFGSQFTDVLSFNIEFEFTTPESAEDDVIFFLYELGAFSVNDVVIGNYDPALPLPFDPQVCDWYEFGCQAKNGVNDFVSWFYDEFDIEEITASLGSFFESANDVINLLPSDLSAVFAIIGGALVAIAVVVIVDRITGGGSS